MKIGCPEPAQTPQEGEKIAEMGDSGKDGVILHFEIRRDGKPVNPLAFDGTLNPQKGGFAVSTWRGVTLENEKTVLTAKVINSFGEASCPAAGTGSRKTKTKATRQHRLAGKW